MHKFISRLPACTAAAVMAACLVLAAAGCASNQVLISRRNLQQAAHLKKFCEANEISSTETHRADQLFASSVKAVNEGNENESFWSSDMAVTYYRLAIKKNHLQKTDIALTSLKNAIQEDEEQLSSLKDVYEEIKSIKR